MDLLYSMFLHFISLLLDVVRWLTHIFLFVLYFGRKKTVSEATEPLLLTSATVLTNQIREGKVKCEDVIKTYIRRINEVQSLINAVVDKRFSEALVEAKAVDDLIASGRETIEDLRKNKPLLGVPFSIKNLIAVKGLNFTCGCYLRENHIAQEDAKAVTLLRDAGAIVLCSTNCPEFGLSLDSSNKLHGRTRNPHDTTHTAGGSSGGEGALVSASGSLIGLGNDIGGSVRIPALYGGIFSHKPTGGLISNEGTEPNIPVLFPFLTSGPMCRYAEDLLLSMKALTAHRSSELKIGEPVNLSNIKIYYWFGQPHIFSPKPDKETVQRITEVLSHFERTFKAKVQRLGIKEMDQTTNITLATLCFSVGNALHDYINLTYKKINFSLEFVKSLLGRSRFSFFSIVVFHAISVLSNLPDRIKERTEHVKDKLNTELEDCLDERAVLFLPTAAKPYLYHSEFTPYHLGLGYTGICNILGNPATHCPIGRNQKGHPLGMQVVGAKYNDNLTMAIGLEIEKAFGGWIAPNPKY